MLYQNCREFPIHNFNECDLYQDYKYVVKEGEYTNEQMERQWINLYTEYTELLNDSSTNKILSDKADIIQLEVKYNILIAIKLASDLIEEYKIDDAEVIDFINKTKSKYRVNDINKAITVTYDRLNSKIEEVKSYITDNKSKGIDDLLPYLISKGYSVDRYRTTVSEWVGIIHHLKQEQKRINSQNVKS